MKKDLKIQLCFICVIFLQSCALVVHLIAPNPVCDITLGTAIPTIWSSPEELYSDYISRGFSERTRESFEGFNGAPLSASMRIDGVLFIFGMTAGKGKTWEDQRIPLPEKVELSWGLVKGGAYLKSFDLRGKFPEINRRKQKYHLEFVIHEKDSVSLAIEVYNLGERDHWAPSGAW